VFSYAFTYTNVCNFKVESSGINSITSNNGLSPEDIGQTSPETTYISNIPQTSYIDGKRGGGGGNDVPAWVAVYKGQQDGDKMKNLIKTIYCAQQLLNNWAK
jgi:hypothetical protein